ncbi:hypothetical protein NQZ68_004917 [Dissostichus eleginoides]|nr:hypothetical protein NQZ68_004917 [Dissostichus eleginoides]
MALRVSFPGLSVVATKHSLLLLIQSSVEVRVQPKGQSEPEQPCFGTIRGCDAASMRKDVQETSAVTTRCAMCPLALQEPGGGGGHAVSDLLEPSNHGPAAMFKVNGCYFCSGCKNE